MSAHHHVNQMWSLTEGMFHAVFQLGFVEMPGIAHPVLSLLGVGKLQKKVSRGSCANISAVNTHPPLLADG